MRSIGKYNTLNSIGKYFAESVVFIAIFISSCLNIDWKPALSGSSVLLFSLQRGRKNSKLRKLSPVIAPDIWALGKNDFE